MLSQIALEDVKICMIIGLIQLAELIYEYCGIDFLKSSLTKILERLKELTFMLGRWRLFEG